MKKILILGAGLEQSLAIREARELGYFVIACDENPRAVGFANADISHVIDIQNEREVTRVARECSVGGVFAHAVEIPHIVANVATKLGLPCVPPDVAVKATPDGQEALRKVSDTPEYQALFRSKSFTQGEPDVDSCQWDNPTKKLVLAIYWITQSKGFVRISNSIDVSKNQARAVTRIDELNKETEKSTNKTKKLIRQAVEELGGFPEGFFPLEPEDSNEEGFIRSLVVEIVNRELGPSS